MCEYSQSPVANNMSFPFLYIHNIIYIHTVHTYIHTCFQLVNNWCVQHQHKINFIVPSFTISVLPYKAFYMQFSNLAIPAKHGNI